MIRVSICICWQTETKNISRICVRHCSKWFMSRLKNIETGGKRIEILWSSTDQKSQKTLQKKCLLATKKFWRTQKAVSKNLIFDGKIKPSQILGKMWNIYDQQGKLSQLCVIAVTNAHILEGNFPSILFARDN